MEWRRPSAGERQVALLWAGAVVVSVALRPLWLVLPPWLPVCTLRRWTGVPCPTCGSGRALTALLHLDPWGALAFNPLVTLAAVAFFVGGIVAPVWIALGGRVPHPRVPLPLSLRLAAVAALVANWIYLIAAGV